MLDAHDTTLRRTPPSRSILSILGIATIPRLFGVEITGFRSGTGGGDLALSGWRQGAGATVLVAGSIPADEREVTGIPRARQGEGYPRLLPGGPFQGEEGSDISVLLSGGGVATHSDHQRLVKPVAGPLPFRWGSVGSSH